MPNSITYQYASPSQLKKGTNQEELFLAKYNEVQKKQVPCFFWGKLMEPFLTARCLLALSNVVKSSFNLSPFQMALLKDPVVTAGNGKIRFEGFSHCAGVYARVDVLPAGHDGEFLENGTTNVDFNEPMLAALNSVRPKEKVVLSVGRKEFTLTKGGEKTVERKVPLPTKWIKGLTSVQLYLADSELVFSFNRLQAIQLFKSLPKGKQKTDYYLIKRGPRVQFSPVNLKSKVCIGGIHRLRLLEGLLPLADKLEVYSHRQQQSTTWQLYFGPIRFSLSLSRDFWRGFSGEGAALESLVEDIPAQWIQHFDNFSFANQAFNPTTLAIEENLDIGTIDNLTGRLSAMGMLGYDVEENAFFYRRLPFKLTRILSLNPRLKNAQKLLDEGKVKVLSNHNDRVEAQVAGTGVKHLVVLNNNQQRCTCTWYNQYQGERGICKHILAVKKAIVA